jgi:hypothetical protein
MMARVSAITRSSSTTKTLRFFISILTPAEDAEGWNDRRYGCYCKHLFRVDYRKTLHARQLALLEASGSLSAMDGDSTGI